MCILSFKGIVKELEQITKQIKLNSSSQKSRLYSKLQQLLITLQDLNDEKIIYSNQMTEMIEIKYRQVDLDYTNLGSFSTARRDEILVEVSNLIKQDRVQSPVPSLAVAKSSKSIADQVFSNFPTKTSSNPDSNLSTSTNNSNNDMNASAISNQDRGSKRARRNRETIDVDKIECLDLPIKMEVAAVSKPATSAQSVASSSNQIVKKVAANALTGKKKKRKAGRQTTNQTNQTISRDQTVAPVLPPEETIDPDEPTYCLCDQISYGEMIMCDNDSCSIEWFHFSCVSLLTKPKGNYY